MLFRTIHDIAVMMDRERVGREASPSAGAYDRTRLMDQAAFRDFVVEVVRRIDNEPGFRVLPRRWMVGRTFGWVTRWRRPVRAVEWRVGQGGGRTCRIRWARVHSKKK